MKLPLSFRNRHGSTLVVVLVLCSITLLILASALKWSTTNVTLSERNNEYYRTVAVAEAATEKVISRLMADYKTGGETAVRSNSYTSVVPTASENARFGKYQFSDGDGHTNSTLVRYMPPTQFRLLTGRYKNLYGYATPFRVISNAKQLDSLFNVTAAVAQDFDVTTIPLFQFAIFYNLDLEINPGPDMTITGPVFSNEDIYVAPGATLTFQDDVKCAGTIYENRKDNGNPPGGTINYGGDHEGGASSLNLPIGTNNTPAAVREVVEVPPGGESATSDMGKERFYNKADMIIKIDSAGNITVTSGRVNNFATTIPRQQWDVLSNANNGGLGFITTNVSFFNKRENKKVLPIQIDIGKLNLWNSRSTNMLRSLLTNNAAAGNITIVYAVDQRAHTTTESGVRLANGQTLLPKGLTVATPNPAYIWGHYNVTNSALGTTNTLDTKPAAVVADAITILSPNWLDALSTLSLSSRSPVDTTVNAAFLAGIVETTNTVYSGGVENYPRFLEKWNGSKTFTYNGSMVVMYPSKYAVGLWLGTGNTFDIYDAPRRKWGFDQNFRDVTKLPPGTPMMRGVVRSTWAMIRPNTTNVVASP